jgi:chromosome segregation ATPase
VVYKIDEVSVVSNGRTFKKAEIKAWHDELTRIPQDVANQEANIRTDQASAEASRESLEQVRAVIQPLDVNIEALKSQIGILTNQADIVNRQTFVAQQQAKIDQANPELPTLSATLTAANAAVERTKFLQQIKSAQNILYTHPAQISQLQIQAGDLNRSVMTENSAVSSLSTSISQLQSEISTLDYAEREDRRRHEEAAAAARLAQQHHHYDHHHHHHHHDHHDHHGHDDHHHHHQASFLDIVVASVGAVAAIGEYVADSNRSYRLSAARSALLQQQSQYQQHQHSASSYSSQYNQTTQRLSSLQSALSQNQQWLLSVPYEQQVNATNSNSDKLAAELSQQEHEQRSISLNLKQLQNRIANWTQEVITANKIITRLHQDNDRLARLSANRASNNDPENLAKQLASEEAAKAPHAVRARALVMEIDRLRNNIRHAQEEILRLAARQRELAGNQFLTQLRDQPALMQSTLIQLAEAAITTFDAEHPANQSEREAAAMYEMKQDARFIQDRMADDSVRPSSQGEEQVEGQVAPIVIPEYKAEADGLVSHPARQVVYQLCGMLLSKQATLDASYSSANPSVQRSALASELKKVSNQFPLNAAEVIAEYKKLQRPVMSSDDMLNEEIRIYDAAALTLRTRANSISKDVKEWNAFARSALALADSIDANKKHPDFDVTLYTKMLIAADALLARPNNTASQEAFDKLAKLDPIGKSSNCKRRSGICFMFLGAALAVTTAVADKFGYLEDVAHEHTQYA